MLDLTKSPNHSNISLASDRARRHPKVHQLVSTLYDNDQTGGLIAYNRLRDDRKIMPFWREMMIIELNDAGHKFVYWGSLLTEYFSRDLTGHYYDPALYGEDTDVLVGILEDVAENQTVHYSHGNLYDRNGKFIDWNAVSIPLRKHSDCDHIARFILHDV